MISHETSDSKVWNKMICLVSTCEFGPYCHFSDILFWISFKIWPLKAYSCTDLNCFNFAFMKIYSPLDDKSAVFAYLFNPSNLLYFWSVGRTLAPSVKVILKWLSMVNIHWTVQRMSSTYLLHVFPNFIWALILLYNGGQDVYWASERVTDYSTEILE